MLGWWYQKRRGRRNNPRQFRDRPMAYVLQWVVCVAIIAGGGYLFYLYLHESDGFSVRWIRVEGARVLDPEAILAASGITTADNLLFFDADAARARVEAMPYVKSCRLERVFPDRVVLTLEERAPVATLLVDNHLFELDAEGVVLRELPANAPYPGPLVTNVPHLGYVEPGQQLAQPPVAAALAVWDAFSEVSMAQDVIVSELAAFGENEVLMYCDELPFEIRWGRRDFMNQARRLDLLWRKMGKQVDCQEYLDLRFGKDLACK